MAYMLPPVEPGEKWGDWMYRYRLNEFKDKDTETLVELKERFEAHQVKREKMFFGRRIFDSFLGGCGVERYDYRAAKEVLKERTHSL